MNALASPLDRGREELLAAQALLDAGFPSQAVSRASTGAINAATAALLALGEMPLTEAGVVAAFARRMVVDDRLDPDHARALRKLFEDGNDVDRALAEAPREEAEDAIASARVVVAAAARIVDERARPGA